MDESLAPNLGLEDLRWLRRLAGQLVQDPDDADDAVQDTVLAALTRAPGSLDAPRGWLARVLHNAVRQGRRGAARRAARERESGVRDPARSTAEVVEELAWHRTLVDQVNALAEPYRTTIVLRFLRDRSPREIAREQELPVKTVHTRIERGLAHLRRALDRGHGGDRRSWMSALAAVAVPVEGGAGAGSLVIGGIAMGTMTKVSGAVLVAAACVYFATRTPPAEPPRMTATVEPPAAGVELVEAELLPSAEGPATEAARRSPVVEEPPARAAAARGTKVLRVVLEGISGEDARRTRVTLTGVDERHAWPAEIRDAWPCQGLTSEFDLDPFLASAASWSEDLHLDELEVEVDPPLHLLETTRVPLTRGVELEGGRTVYEVRVRLVPAAVIHGRLVREDGAPAAEGLVGALRLEEAAWERPTTTGSTLTDVPVEDEGRAVECAADGAFELRVPASGRHALASFEAGRRPTTTRLEVLVGTRVDAGTLVLEPGHGITGHALRRGIPMAGATVALTQPRTFWAADPADVEWGMNAWIPSWRTFRTRARSVTLAWLEGRFELSGQRAGVDGSGAFAFGGLAPREYRLRVAELPGSRFVPGGWDDPGFDEQGPDERVVRAPAHGIVLEHAWTSIRFELGGDLESEDEGRLILRTRSLYPGNERIHVPESWSTQFPLSGDEPTFVLQAPATVQMLGEVLFPGRQPVPLDFRTPEPGGEVVVPVELAPAEEAATLVIELENPPAELPETFTVLLKRAGQADTPEMRTVEVRAGRLRMEGIVPGPYRVVVCACEDPNHPGLFYRNELELELHPGRSATRSIAMRQGAGLRLTLRDEEGELLGGHYELYDDAGNRVRLVLHDSDRWKPGSDAFATTGGFGPGNLRSSDPIDPGRYRLVLVSPGHARRSVTVELREGEYEDVDVTLSK